MSLIPAPATLKRIEDIVLRYPDRDAALLPVLHLLQREFGFISPEAERWTADRLGITPLRVREVLSFYTLFRRAHSGRYVIQVCRNLSCSMAGAEDVVGHLRKTLGVAPGQTTPDGRYTLLTVECLGNCDHAPCLMINDEDHGPVTRETIDEILGALE